MAQSSGRDLMLVKETGIDDEVDKLGLSFHSRSRSGKKYVRMDAFAAGQNAEERFDIRAGIGGR